jgi:hypothetical protein
VGLGVLVLGLGVRREVLEVFGKGVGEGCLLDGFWWGVWELWEVMGEAIGRHEGVLFDYMESIRSLGVLPSTGE